MTARASRSLLLAIIVVAGCTGLLWPGASPDAPFSQESGLIHRFVVHEGALVSSRGTPSPPLERFGLRWPFVAGLARPDPRQRFSRALMRWLDTDDADTTRVRVRLTLVQSTEAPRLPIEAFSLGAAEAKRARAVSDSLWRAYESANRSRLERQLRWLTHRAEARIELLSARTGVLLMSLPRRGLARLVDWNEFVSAEPETVAVAEPRALWLTSNGTTDASVAAAEAQIGLKPYREAGFCRGRIRLLDTGVRLTHPWLAGLPRTEAAALGGPALIPHECVGSGVCTESEVGDVTSGGGHGTLSAGILVARNAPTESRGITDALLHSCRVYAVSDTLFSHAGIESALLGEWSAPAAVSLVEVQDSASPEGSAGRYANIAALNGTVVVAPIGNVGAVTPECSEFRCGPQSPGSARGVLGVGARAMMNLQRNAPGQSYGVIDERQKPDLQFPTGTLTSGNDTEVMSHMGTSGAAPYAAAAALAVRALFLEVAGTVDPGQVYSALLACGSESRHEASTGPPPVTGVGEFPAGQGAGWMRLPATTTGWFGVTSMHSFAVTSVPLHEPPADAREVRAALWWWDPPPIRLPFGFVWQQHRDLDVELVDPEGRVRAQSRGRVGVFERLTLRMDAGEWPAAGTWHLRIRANAVGWKPVNVYWTVLATP